MVPIYSQSFFLSAGETDAEQELSLPLLTQKIIDIATAHANSLGIGNPSMEQLHAGWVLSRVTIEMQKYPRVNDNYTLSTWIESFNRHFSMRCFRIDDATGNAMGFVRTVWMVISTDTHENIGLKHLSIPDGFELDGKCPIKPQGRHRVIVESSIEAKPTELQANFPIKNHTFLYTDLDAYRHVNTVRYMSLLLNQFSLEEFDRSYIERVELSFLHEAHYGLPVELLRHDYDNLDSAFFLRDEAEKKPILYAHIRRKLRQ